MTNIMAFLGLSYYTSDLDEFLADYDKSHNKLSISQRKEVTKYNRINALRDNPNQPKVKEDFWEHF